MEVTADNINKTSLVWFDSLLAAAAAAIMPLWSCWPRIISKNFILFPPFPLRINSFYCFYFFLLCFDFILELRTMTDRFLQFKSALVLTFIANAAGALVLAHKRKSKQQ